MVQLPCLPPQRIADVCCWLLQVQLRDEVALVKDGQVQHVLSGSGSRGIFPHVAEVAPIAANSVGPVKLTVTGTRISAEHNAVLARYRGEAALKGQ